MPGSPSRRGAPPVLWRADLRAFALVAPLMIFMLSAFLYPICIMLFTAVDNGLTSTQLTKTSVVLDDWDGDRLPPAAVYPALAADLKSADEAGYLAKMATELNYRLSGFRSLMLKTQHGLAAGTTADQQGFVQLDPRWNDTRFWKILQRSSARLTSANLLASLDLESKEDGGIGKVPENRRVYLTYLYRTLVVSLSVTGLTLVIGYVIAFAIAQAQGRMARILLILVLLPFWTSLLVRTAAWVVILQRQGMLNEVMMWLGMVQEPIQLVFNRFGVLIGMTHVLLPFAVLPIHSVMKGIKPSQLNAASSLGARPFRAFATVYLPQTMPGVIAGGLLVFVLANGFYITPALLGGASDQLISSLIADLALERANWGMSSALAIVLFVTIVAVLIVFGRFVKVREVRI